MTCKTIEDRLGELGFSHLPSNIPNNRLIVNSRTGEEIGCMTAKEAVEFIKSMERTTMTWQQALEQMEQDARKMRERADAVE